MPKLEGAARWLPLLGLWVLLLSACAPQIEMADYDVTGDPVKLQNVPFMAHDSLEGGPAVLAMSLAVASVQVDPVDLQKDFGEALDSKDSPAAMIDTAALHDRAPYRLVSSQTDLDAISELRAGRPVILLLRRGFPFKRWRFALLVGVDPPHSEFILRTGDGEERHVPYGELLQQWQPSHYWALVVVHAGDIPKNAVQPLWLEAAGALKNEGKAEAALQAYDAATHRWTDNAQPWNEMGNIHYGLHHYRDAVQDYLTALHIAPDDAAIHANLAVALVDAHCADQGEDEINKAIKLETDPQRLEHFKRMHDQIDDMANGPSLVCPLE